MSCLRYVQMWELRLLAIPSSGYQSTLNEFAGVHKIGARVAHVQLSQFDHENIIDFHH